ncbi:hypothetical protein ACN9MB_13255 [Dyella kyungheensis]|uniref:hypothetical protein n=1 Tax=Dyella kyungheensis TaxID=1242174 RepID=UPI003CF50213
MSTVYPAALFNARRQHRIQVADAAATPATEAYPEARFAVRRQVRMFKSTGISATRHAERLGLRDVEAGCSVGHAIETAYRFLRDCRRMADHGDAA